jgi:hypothetical protein
MDTLIEPYLLDLTKEAQKPYYLRTKEMREEGTTCIGTQPAPAQNSTWNPEILPKTGGTITRATTPEGDVAEASLDFIFPEEGKGDKTSGNKELRDEGEHEDENKSKRPKVPLHPPHRKMREPQQLHTISNTAGHKQTKDPDPSLTPCAHNDSTIETTPPQPLSTSTTSDQISTTPRIVI